MAATTRRPPDCNVYVVYVNSTVVTRPLAALRGSLASTVVMATRAPVTAVMSMYRSHVQFIAIRLCCWRWRSRCGVGGCGWGWAASWDGCMLWLWDCWCWWIVITCARTRTHARAHTHTLAHSLTWGHHIHIQCVIGPVAHLRFQSRSLLFRFVSCPLPFPLDGGRLKSTKGLWRAL